MEDHEAGQERRAVRYEVGGGVEHHLLGVIEAH
jgi:hypothetical protein